MPWEPLPPRGEDVDPRAVGESLDRIARSLGVPAARALTGVFDGWEELVGPSVAARTRPLRIDGGALVIGVDDPAWATQLRWLEADLVARLAPVVGEGAVTRIEVRVQPRTGRPAGPAGTS